MPKPTLDQLYQNLWEWDLGICIHSNPGSSLGKLLNLSLSQFPHLYDEGNKVLIWL